MEDDFNIDDIDLGGDLMSQLSESKCNMPLQIKPRNKKVDDIQLSDDCDDLENEFVQNSRSLIEMSLGAVDSYSSYANASQSAEDIEALSKLIASASSALSQIQKFSYDKKRLKQQKIIEDNKINSKERINSDNNESQVLLSREQILAQIAMQQKELELKAVKGDAIDIPYEEGVVR